SFLKRFLNYKFVLPSNTGSSNLQVLFNRTTISDLQSRIIVATSIEARKSLNTDDDGLTCARNKLYTFHILTLNAQKRKHVHAALRKKNKKKRKRQYHRLTDKDQLISNYKASDVSNESQQVCSYGYTEFSTTPGLAICFCQDEKM
ncbi:hypothetical protein V1477_019139, partial [Vespula maculifrons]